MTERRDRLIHTVWSASIKVNKPRGLLFYAVSIFNMMHRHGHALTAMQAIKEIVHPESRMPNVVIHVTDRIYAFNFMMDDPGLSYEEARELAREAGLSWINSHRLMISSTLDFFPVTFDWSQWDTKHRDEYRQVLSLIEELHSGDDEVSRAFRASVNEDVERFVARELKRREYKGWEPDEERIRNLSRQFVLHEATGYILIGRHLVKDYLQAIYQEFPELGFVIDGHGGLMDGAFRIYPGGQLKAIEWLQKNAKKLPENLRGAERYTSVKIDFKYVNIPEAYAGKSIRMVTVLQEYERVMAKRRGEVYPVEPPPHEEEPSFLDARDLDLV